MTRDAAFWEDHWSARADGGAMASSPPTPHLVEAAAGLTPGTALDAGTGAGADALWLAAAGWRVTAADISRTALDHAADRATGAPGAERVAWLQADLGDWTPEHPFDLVTSAYAHADLPQLELYARLAGWVAPGGTLVIVGHDAAHGHAHGHGHDGDEPPAAATATADAIVRRLGAGRRVVTAESRTREVGAPGATRTLRDVVVVAQREA